MSGDVILRSTVPTPAADAPTVMLHPEGHIVVAGTTYKLKPGSTITLDENWSPYVQSSVVLPFSTAVAGLDPRTRTWVTIDATIDGTTRRTFQLHLRARTIPAGTPWEIQLDLASDEALLQDWAALTTADYSQYTGSAKNLINAVLAQVIPGAVLAADPPAVDIAPYWQVTNLLKNPSLEVDATGWISVGGASALTRNASGNAPQGGYTLKWTLGGNASHVAPLAALSDLPVEIGQPYTFSAYVAAPAGRTIRANIQWRNANGTAVVSTILGATVPSVASTYVRVSMTATPPPGVTHVTPYVSVLGGVAGEFAYVDAAMFYTGTTVLPYFDGATPADAHYSYVWTGDPHASASTRVPVVARDPAMFTWKPGVNAWDFLTGIIGAVGLRLFCDEKRVWRAVGADYTVDGVIVLDGANVTDGSDTVSREAAASDEPPWATGVVVHYAWQDTTGSREAYDAAGTSERVYTVEKGQAYPGPGEAAATLKGLSLRGHTEQDAALGRITTTPGMGTTITTQAGSTSGRVRSVSFELDTGLMTVAGKLLGEVPAGSWSLVPDDQTWATIPGDPTWDQWVF